MIVNILHSEIVTILLIFMLFIVLIGLVMLSIISIKKLFNPKYVNKSIPIIILITSILYIILMVIATIQELT